MINLGKYLVSWKNVIRMKIVEVEEEEKEERKNSHTLLEPISTLDIHLFIQY